MGLPSFSRRSIGSACARKPMTTVWVHEVSPCAGCLDVFHSNRTLVLALDTDPGVDPNQKQGARPVLRHMNEAYQTCKASKWLCKCLICSGDFEAYHAADGFHGLICLRANNKVRDGEQDAIPCGSEMDRRSRD